MYYINKREYERREGNGVRVEIKIYDGIKRKIQNFLLRGGMCMLSFLIKERKCLYRNIPVIKFCYMSEKGRRERETEKERKRAERRKNCGSDKNKNAKTV